MNPNYLMHVPPQEKDESMDAMHCGNMTFTSQIEIVLCPFSMTDDVPLIPDLMLKLAVTPVHIRFNDEQSESIH